MELQDYVLLHFRNGLQYGRVTEASPAGYQICVLSASGRVRPSQKWFFTPKECGIVEVLLAKPTNEQIRRNTSHVSERDVGKLKQMIVDEMSECTWTVQEVAQCFVDSMTPEQLETFAQKYCLALQPNDEE